MPPGGTTWTPRIARRCSTVVAPDRRTGGAASIDPAGPFSPALRDALLLALYASGSDLLTLPVQDIFGWTDRINMPGLVDDRNWTWKLPWPVDALDAIPEARERQAALRGGRSCIAGWRT